MSPVRDLAPTSRRLSRRRRAPASSTPALVVLAAALAGSCAPAQPDPADGPAEGARTAPRPSVILVSLDTVRADHLGLYGYERDTTPCLERFARDALVFERAFAPVSWTLPSHMTLLTGLYPSQHGVARGSLALNPSLPLLAERLSAAGYETAATYGCRWLDPRHGFARGFDHYARHDDAGDAGEELAALLDRLERSEPFFLFVHLFDAHCTRVSRPGNTFYDPPAPFDERFLPGARGRLADVDFEREWRGEDFLEPEEVEALVALYDSGLAHLDATLGRWLGEWERRGLLDDALVILTSDHGEALAQRDGRIEGHGGVFQDGLHVPLVVRPPGGAEGRRVHTPVSLVDVVPTVLDACGLPAEPGLAGHSLLAPPTEERILEAGSHGVRVRVLWPWKLGHRIGQPRPDVLYHLGEDPGELAPLGPQDPRFESVVERIRAVHGARRGQRVQADPVRIGAPDAAVRKALRALGYGEEELGTE